MLNGNDLGDFIKLNVDAAVATSRVAGEAQRQAVFRALGNSIVQYFQANAQVVVASVSAVTPGVGISGPGTGTIT